MAAVAALRDAEHMLVRGGKLPDDLPGTVAAAVVDIEDAARLGDLACLGQLTELLPEQGRRDRQDLLLVVAWDHDIQNRVHLVSSSRKAARSETFLKYQRQLSRMKRSICGRSFDQPTAAKSTPQARAMS